MAERRRLQRRSDDSSTSPRSPRRISSLHLSNPNIFSDEFALEHFNVSNPTSPSTHDSSDLTDTTPASSCRDHLNTSNNSSSEKRKQLRPSDSTSRHGSMINHNIRNSVVSQSDSPFADPVPHRHVSTRTTSTISHGPQRSLSTASSFAPPRAASPYRGPTGPSHPYSMYPQGVTRSSTVSSNATVRPPERAFVPGRGPEHPYSMYPQNTVPEMEENLAMSFTDIPVGFPGHAPRHYQRQMGPDGEDIADIIGPDGHTEQLPPYTRYPDGIGPKTGFPGPASILSEERPADVEMAEPGTPQERSTSRTAVVPGVPPSDQSTNDTSGSFKEKWTEKGKKRVCRGCMPLWVAVLIAFLFFLGIIIGGVIGGVTARRSGLESGQDQAQAQDTSSPSTIVSTVVSTSFIDATPIPTPFGIPSPPLGTYNIPIENVKESSDTCLNSNSGFAWGCESSGNLVVHVANAPGGGLDALFMTNTDWYNGSVIYGPQPPILNLSPYSLSLMKDKDSPSLGPALFFWDYYDKIVIVPESCFGSNSKRDVSESEIFERGVDVEEGSVAVAGTKPWFCVWNATVVEVFIYMQQNITEAQAAAAPTSTSTAAVPLTTIYSASATVSSSSIPSPASQSSIAGDVGGAAQSTSNPYDMGHEYYHHGSTSYFNPNPNSHDSSSSPGSDGWHINNRRSTSNDPNINPTYPRVVKVEEKRKSSNPVSPYCQQYQVLNDGTAGPLMDDDGNPIMQYLTEMEPGPSSKRRNFRWENNFAARFGALRRRETVDNSNCYCEWMSE